MMGPISAGDASGVYALLAALADPQGCKQRLDELKAAQDAAAKATTELTQKQAQYDKDIKQLNTDKAKFHAVAEAQAVRAKELIARENAVAQNERQMQSRGAELQKYGDEQRTSLMQREAQVQAAEGRLQNARKAMEQVQVDARAIKIEYEAKLAKLRELA